MKKYWGNLVDKVDSMSLRERVMIFAAAASMLIALTDALFHEPLLAEREKLSAKVIQQQEKMQEIQSQIDASLQARKDNESSPLRKRLEQARKQLAEGDIYLQGRRDRLVEPEKMAELLEQVLNQNGRLQLINLQTLPVAPLNEKMEVNPVAASAPAGGEAVLDKQVFKHGVVITVRGKYLDLLQYLAEIEKLPTQMFWGNAEMKVEQYPDVELKLTLYTLSLEKSWLQI